MFAGIKMIVVALIAIAASLAGAIIIYLVTSLMIEESRSTISLMKVVGYRGKEVDKFLKLTVSV